MNNRLRYFLNPLIFIFFVCASTYGAFSQQPPAEKSPGSISGRLSSQQKPLSGIVVQLIGPPRPGQFKKTQVAQVVTDDGGNYNFRSIAPGTYDVVPVTGAYTIPEMTRDFGPGKTVTVASGENISNIDFELGLAATIRGQIKDADGHPVSSQALALVIVEKDRSQSRFPARGITVKPSDAQGNYSIDNVPPGRYLLSTERPDSTLMRGRPGAAKRVVYPLIYYPSATDPQSAKVIEVAPGAALTGIDITIGEPLKTYQIVGQVIDEKTGAPISKVAFGMKYSGMNRYGFDTSNLGWNSDANGQFNIAALPGHFIIRPGGSATDNVYGDPIELDVIDKDVTGLIIKMHHGSTLSGKVVVEGAASAADMEKLVKQKYFLLLSQSGRRPAGLVQAKIDSDGHFQFASLGPGRVKFDLHAGIAGVQNDFSILKIKRDDQDLPDGIEVGDGEDVTGLQIILQSAGGVRGIIRGEVKIEGGDLEGVHLSVLYRRTDSDPNTFSSVQLDVRNHFVLEGMVPGDYEFMIGPMSLTVSNEAGSRTMQRMPTVKQTAKVTAGAESEVILTMKLRPQ